MTDVVDIEVIDAEILTKIVEINVPAKVKRTGQGTYTLTALPGGGTRITFEYRWRSSLRGRPSHQTDRPRLHPPQQHHGHASSRQTARHRR